ncbi:Glucosamine-phosphate N-acetyltransferase-like protein [Cymbomonas tetramitiformis]|uniref:Glucosamine 6-phosphate N-acetyltransferase n=1 Tax=Cymbomonas tetramitiformis TaxID=36881 RepID=A0AAE0EWI8_9CHLO|nr:Glucosamine-phosphate N-acetyltransferase-like protein [Cymbomonas tetramitiformis]
MRVQVGHIEDIVVKSTCRGKNLGRMIIAELKKIASDAGCYKVILDCDEKNVEFYEKCGYERKAVQMATYF